MLELVQYTRWNISVCICRRGHTQLYENGEFKYPVTSFCSDYSFWSEEGKCLDGNKAENFTEARKCNADFKNTFGIDTEEACLKKKFRTNENKTEGSFYCKQSKTCIQKSWACDGHVNCIMCKHLPTTGDIFEMSPVLGKCLYTIYGQAFA